MAGLGEIDDQPYGGSGFMSFDQQAFSAPFDQAFVSRDAGGQKRPEAARR